MFWTKSEGSSEHTLRLESAEFRANIEHHGKVLIGKKTVKFDVLTESEFLTIDDLAEFSDAIDELQHHIHDHWHEWPQ